MLGQWLKVVVKVVVKVVGRTSYNTQPPSTFSTWGRLEKPSCRYQKSRARDRNTLVGRVASIVWPARSLQQKPRGRRHADHSLWREWPLTRLCLLTDR